MRTFTLDPSVRRVGQGTVLIGGSPLKLFRLTDAGAQRIDSIERGEQFAQAGSVGGLLERLVDAGVLHPHYTRTPADTEAQVAGTTVVIPAHDVPHSDITRLVANCIATAGHYLASVIVVDDASNPPLFEVPGATIVRRNTNGGPGAARSSGFEKVTTPFVAFVDTDVELSPNWLEPLLAHFHDDRVGLVAPRITSVPGPSAIARYEVSRSPLDLGVQPARVRAGTRVSYVPSAALVCRAEALSAVGGFATNMRVGEDVDLVWRLDESGWRARYEPSVAVTHRPRGTSTAWMRQRYTYGTSAAMLEQRHPGALAPVRVSGWSATSWLAVAAGWPIVGTAIAGITTVALARKLRHIPDGAKEAVRLAGLGHLFAGRSLANAVTRAWWPLAAIAALVSKRARRAVIVAAIAPPMIDWFRERPSIDPARYVGLRLLDDVAYGAGLMRGALDARSIDSLRPDFTSWPNSPRSRRSPPNDR